jgi:hypothetical protein
VASGARFTEDRGQFGGELRYSGKQGLMFQSVVIMVATIAVAVGCAAIVFRVMGARQEQQREAIRQ